MLSNAHQSSEAFSCSFLVPVAKGKWSKESLGEVWHVLCIFLCLQAPCTSWSASLRVQGLRYPCSEGFQVLLVRSSQPSSQLRALSVLLRQGKEGVSLGKWSQRCEGDVQEKMRSFHQELWQNTLFGLIRGIEVSLSVSLDYHLCFS